MSSTIAFHHDDDNADDDEDDNNGNNNDIYIWKSLLATTSCYIYKNISIYKDKTTSLSVVKLGPIEGSPRMITINNIDDEGECRAESD